MIDWYPPTTSPTPATDLHRWQASITMRRVARAIDARDPSTAGHSERVADVAALIAAEVGWSRRSIVLLREAGAIHDIGKVCVPESILMTPGTLTPDEYEIVKTHADLGARIAAGTMSSRQVSWIRHHHERWDGRGYPDRLRAEEICDGAAILSVADAWDAMTSRSWDRIPLSRGQALEECERESGRQFAPWAVSALRRAMAIEVLQSPIHVAPLRLISAA